MSDIDNKQPDAGVGIDEQAARWLVRMNCDTCSAEDIAEHKAWLDANLMHRKAYLRLESLWGELGNYSDRPEITALRQQAKSAANAESAKLGQVVPLVPTAPLVTTAPTLKQADQRQTSKDAKHGRSKRTAWLSTALAASLMIVVVGLGFVRQSGWNEASQDLIYQTAIGEQKTIQLTDGSELVLDTQTRLKVFFSEYERRILLEQGQAHFDVAHDKNRPFVVAAGKGKITALGTAFVVRKEENEVRVTLLEGRVEVVQQEAPSIVNSVDRVPAFLPIQTRELLVGQQVAYSDKGMAEKESVDIEQVTAWQQGRLIYEDQSLADVITDLNRYSERKVVLGDESLASIRVNGVFKPGDDGRAIQALASYFSMLVTRDAYGNLLLLPATE